MARALHALVLIIVFLERMLGAVLPPPWANPKLNPCATQPGGWQLLYWPPDGKCYKIFKTGYPCPDDMELSPAASKAGEQKLSAECRCPPMKAQSARDGKCYDLYTRGPCEKGYYFAPDTKYNNYNTSSKRTWGICNQIQACPSPNEIFWPKDGKCYQKLTKGPCAKGQLITNSSDKIAECKCNKYRELRDYRYNDGNCYQHFTKGPCKEKGHLFLPDRSCGCHSFLPHFHDESEHCFEIGSIGPCAPGENFQLHPETRRGTCECKSGYIRYQNTSCHRPFTQGPCDQNYILLNSTVCIKQPCQRGYLYFAKSDACYRIGTRGPCPKGRLVTFDFSTRPSVDGISYNGVCSCEKHVYSNECSEDEDIIECNKSDGTVLYQKRCYKLYTQGPCPKGAWIAPKRQKKEEIWSDGDSVENEGVCECVPGYTRTVRTSKSGTRVSCMAPTVILAEFLNRNFTAIAQIFSL